MMQRSLSSGSIHYVFCTKSARDYSWSWLYLLETAELKVKSSVARSHQWRIYYHSLWGQLSTTCSNATEVAQWAAPSSSQSQRATDNGVRDGRSNWLSVIPTLYRAVTPERRSHGAKASQKSQVYSSGRECGTLGHFIGCAATNGSQ